MDRQWEAILYRYGQSVEVCTDGECRQVKAFMQNMIRKHDEKKAAAAKAAETKEGGEG